MRMISSECNIILKNVFLSLKNKKKGWHFLLSGCFSKLLKNEVKVNFNFDLKRHHQYGSLGIIAVSQWLNLQKIFFVFRLCSWDINFIHLCLTHFDKLFSIHSTQPSFLSLCLTFCSFAFYFLLKVLLFLCPLFLLLIPECFPSLSSRKFKLFYFCLFFLPLL